MVSRLDFPTIKLDWILDKCQVTSQSNQQSTIISQHSRPQPLIVNCTVNIYRNDKVYPYSGFQSLSSDPNVCRLNESSGGEDAPKALPSVFQKVNKIFQSNIYLFRDCVLISLSRILKILKKCACFLWSVMIKRSQNLYLGVKCYFRNPLLLLTMSQTYKRKNAWL